MAKVIIGIHGLGNKPAKETLERWWISSMQEGLIKLGKSPKLPKFEMVYWADVLNKNPLDEKILEMEHPLFLDEKYSPGLTEFNVEENSLRQKVLDFMEEQLDKLFLNKDLTVNYSGITDLIISRYFKDLETYYHAECLDDHNDKCNARDLIRDRLVQTIKKYEGHEIMITSHSMGTIIAYDVLTFLVPDIDIHSLVTMGSPLGFPVVQGKIAAEWQSKRLVPPKLKTPPGVRKHWYNFADLKDRIALIYDLSENFQPNYLGVEAEDFVVHNDYHSGLDYNPHKSFGYLRAPEFANVLAKFAQNRKPVRNFLKWIFKAS